jgi:hypothetical protein
MQSAKLLDTFGSIFQHFLISFIPPAARKNSSARICAPLFITLLAADGTLALYFIAAKKLP